MRLRCGGTRLRTAEYVSEWGAGGGLAFPWSPLFFALKGILAALFHRFPKTNFGIEIQPYSSCLCAIHSTRIAICSGFLE